MFVHPSDVAEIVRRHPEIARARLVVEGGGRADDRMTLRVETGAVVEGLGQQVERTIRDVTRLRGDVQLVGAGSLPNDGKVIEDLRSPG
jgi:phenylacetate-CoA ligase